MYSPRWLALLPLAVLVPAAFILRRRLLWLLLVALAVVIVPIMGLEVPVSSAWASDSGGPRIRVLTCNVNGDNLDSGRLAELVSRTRPDVVALQVWTPGNAAVAAWQADGWHVQLDGDLCLASRYPIRRGESFGYDILRGKGNAQRYDLDTPAGIVSFFNIHIASPRPGLQAVLDHEWSKVPAAVTANMELRSRESDIISQRAAEIDGPLIVAGDFNLPEDSAIYRRCWSRYTDSHEAAGFGFGYTWHTRRFGSLRIDHILAGSGWRFLHSEVGADVHSDHRPVIADLEWMGSIP
jgi:endonuclease/exonuclease/phosphatase (EEP) superfamily protein YafD